MKKFLLLDADGVVMSEGTYFSKRYVTDFSVPTETLLPFFKNEFRECQLGSKNLREILGNYLADWKWQGTVDELLKYWFEDGSLPDVEIMEIVRKAREDGAKVYLATDQEKYRAKYLWNDLGLSKDFDGSFFSCDIGVRKKDALYWEEVLATLGNPDPMDVLFFDDEPENVKVAKNVGIDAHLFTSIDDLRAL